MRSRKAEMKSGKTRAVAVVVLLMLLMLVS